MESMYEPIRLIVLHSFIIFTAYVLFIINISMVKNARNYVEENNY